MEEAPCHHLLAEGHHVCRVIQAPVLVGPELAGAAPARLDLIHQEGTAVLETEEGEINAHRNGPTSGRVCPAETPCSLNREPTLRS